MTKILYTVTYTVLFLLLINSCKYTRDKTQKELIREVTFEQVYDQFVNPSNDRVLVCTHRGYWRSGPENSLLAIENAIKLGVDIIEIDVRKTKDGELIVIHDKSIDRTTTGKGKIAEITLDSIKSVNLKTGVGIKTHYKVPTLEEVMLLVKDKPVLVNLDKAWDCLPESYAVLRKTGTVKQAIFKGSDPVQLLRKKAGSLLDSIIYMPMVWPMDYSIYQRDSIVTPVDYVINFVNQYHPAAFETLFDKEDSPVLDAIPVMKQNNVTVLMVSLWDELCAGHSDERAYNDPDAHWGWLIDKGANVIMTDRPALLLDYLREKGLHD